METGWWRIERPDEVAAIGDTLDAALERGARERRHGQMLATVGHELLNPLTSIRGYIETLLAGDVDAATAKRFLETARREALRLRGSARRRRNARVFDARLVGARLRRRL